MMARRSVGVVLALVVSAWLLIAAAELGPLQGETATPPHPHAHSLMAADGSSTVIDHDHIGRRVVPAPVDGFVAATVPRLDTSLVAHHVAAAATDTTTPLARAVSPTTRGPPIGPPAAPWGRLLLIEFCIARR